MKKTAVLLIGFGGPRTLGEVDPFLDRVLSGVRIPPERRAAVRHHYEIFNGYSPFNDEVEKQRVALEDWLKNQGIACSVHAGFRNAEPLLESTFQIFKQQNVEDVIGVVLSSFHSYASFGKYQDRVKEAQKNTGAENIQVVYTPNFSKDELFIRAQSDKVADLLKTRPDLHNPSTVFIFLAHSIPQSMSDESGYADQFKDTASRVATLVGMGQWQIAYQSRSGRPGDAWLEPDIKNVIEKIGAKSARNVVLVPIGFLCENIEILYDLDTEAKAVAEKSGFKYFRAAAVADHPLLIELLGRQIKSQFSEKLAGTN